MQALLAGAEPDGSADDPPGPPMDDQGLADQFERGLQAVLDGAAARLGIPHRPAGARGNPGPGSYRADPPAIS